MAHDDQYGMMRSGRDGTTPVSELAMRVVSVMNAKQAVAQRGEARTYISNLLVKRIICRAGFDPADLLAELRAYQMPDDMILDTYIPDAARVVGERWVEDDLGFAEVTIASVRLQSLLTELAYSNPDGMTVSLDPLNVLVATCEHEQHTLGAFVAAAQLRRLGATVDVCCGDPAPDIVQRVLRHEYDTVLISTSRRGALETISKMITQVRQHKKSAPLFVVGGIVLDFADNVQHVTGADLVTVDVETVVAFCEQQSERAYETPSRAMR